MLRLSSSQTTVEFSSKAVPALEAQPQEVVRVELGRGLTGPILITGAGAGDVLIVELRRIKVRERGRLAPTGQLWREMTGEMEASAIPVRIDHGLITFPDGFACALRPSLAVIGTAPKGESRSLAATGEHGGLLGCRRIRAGARVYLPCAVTGGLLSLGRLYAATGDGLPFGYGVDVNGTVDVAVHVIKGCDWPLPFGVEGTAAFSFGWGEDLDEAVSEATRRSVLLLSKAAGVSAGEATTVVAAVGQARPCWSGEDGVVTARVEVPLAYFAERGVIL